MVLRACFATAGKIQNLGKTTVDKRCWTLVARIGNVFGIACHTVVQLSLSLAVIWSPVRED